MKALSSQTPSETLALQVKKLLSAKPVKVVAISGGLGKTSTALAIAKVLQATFDVMLIEGSPDTKLYPHNPEEPNLIVLDVDPQQLQSLLTSVRPDLAVITGVSTQPEAELSLARGSNAVVFNNDDDQLCELLSGLEDLTTRGYGSQWGDVHFGNWKSAPDGRITVDLHGPGIRKHIYSSIIANYAMKPLAAAALVGLHFNLPPEVIVKRLNKIESAPGRMKPLAGRRGTLIIDDTYSSTPATALAALATLKVITSKQAVPESRAVAVLGSMTGPYDANESAHRQVGKACGDLNILVTIGDMANKWIMPAAMAAGLSSDQVFTFASPVEAGKYVARMLQQPGDVILVKGSADGVFAEEATKQLLANPHHDVKLVRQSDYWIEEKRDMSDAV